MALLPGSVDRRVASLLFEHDRSCLYFSSSAALHDLVGERLEISRECLSLTDSTKDPVGRRAAHFDGGNNPADRLKKICYIAAALLQITTKARRRHRMSRTTQQSLRFETRGWVLHNM